jgi:hypothetical protein
MEMVAHVEEPHFFHWTREHVQRLKDRPTDMANLISVFTANFHCKGVKTGYTKFNFFKIITLQDVMNFFRAICYI